MEQQGFLEIKRARRNLVLGLIIAIVAVDSIVLLTAGSDLEAMLSDISRIGTIGAASALSLVVVGRQKIKGLFGRAYLALSVGLILWLVAESIWGYYELVLGIETPFPSIADAFWLAAYIPIGYHMFGTAKFFGKGVKKSIIIIVTAAAAMYLAFYVQEIVNVSELEGADALVAFSISVAYPVLDAILIVPAVLIITNAGKGQLTSIPWVFVAMILLIIADSLLGLSQVTNFSSETYHITMIYDASYLCFMAGLIWYNKQFILDMRKMVK